MWQPSPEDLTVERSPLELLLQSAQANVQRTLADQVTPVRLAGHLSVLVVAAFILFISRIEIPNWDISIRSLPTASLEDASLSSGGAVTRISQMLAGQDPNLTFASTSLQRAVVPFTIIPEQPQPGIQAYSVQPGDTVMAIAQKFGLKPESIQWANPDLELNPDLLRIGDQLEILPVDGALHRVKPGDTLSTIAQEYKVSVDDIVGFGANEITDANAPLVSGAQLIIPNGVKPQVAVQVFAYNGAPTTAVKGSGSFVWPTSGSVTQR
ncbi:MAG: LysM peptidoglycan-binding domain-containing protein, partial [Caldilineaceae bacterium]|nr:LysM peptidoglycan-binding domain-containing protein [Caldilineaceae bacterium]